MSLFQPHLWITITVGRPVFGAQQLEALQRVINELLPSWSSGVAVSKGAKEDGYPIVRVDRSGSLFKAVHEAAPPRSGTSSAVLWGAYPGLSLFLTTCHSTHRPELNQLSIEILGLSNVEGRPFDAWVWSLFETLPLQLPVRYGNAYLDEEFRAKNMIDDETGVRAIGVRLDEGLPGLYWLNYFGEPYLKLIGEHQLLSAPAFAVHKVGNGILISLDSSPLNWCSAAYKEREIASITHIGRGYFFLKGEPARQLVAPDFRAGQNTDSVILAEILTPGKL